MRKVLFYIIISICFIACSNDENIEETQSNIDLKTKHDILLEDANAIVNGKKNIIHFIS